MSDVAPRGANLNRLGTFNESVVLHAIRRSAGISRVELGELTGLAGQTVTNICRRLLDSGLIFEGDKARTGRGKPRTSLWINGAARVALGVHLDPAVTTLTMIDLAGESVASQSFPTPSVSEPSEVVARIGEALNRLTERSGVDRSLVVGVGVAAPGPVDLERGVVVDPPHLPHWHRVPLRESLSVATGLPVLLDKDVSAAAVAETWAGTVAGNATSVVLYLGTGIGAGLIVDGRVVRGSSDNAGEMGHIVVDPDGPACGCGQRGCVNTTITSEALVREAVAHGLLEPYADEGGGPLPSVHDLYDLADKGEDRAIAIVRRAATGVARAALVITNLLDADKVILGGPYWSRLAPYVLAAAPPLLVAGAAAHRIHSVEIVGTRVGDHLASVGAASLVLDQAFSPHPTRLVLTR
jgi:predicted NBD/HSP70 family sugar kinase